MRKKKEPGAKEGGWRNRIVGQGEVDPKSLTANPANWRRHPDAQKYALTGVLSDVGWVGRILVNRTTGRIVDGHARVEIAIARSEKHVPVDYVDLSEDEERLVLLTLDPIAAMAESDKDAMDGLIAEVGARDGALGEMIRAMAEQFGSHDVNFKAYDEDAADKVQYTNCPKCKHRFPV